MHRKAKRNNFQNILNVSQVPKKFLEQQQSVLHHDALLLFKKSKNQQAAVMHQLLPSHWSDQSLHHLRRFQSRAVCRNDSTINVCKGKEVFPLTRTGSYEAQAVAKLLSRTISASIPSSSPRNTD